MRIYCQLAGGGDMCRHAHSLLIFRLYRAPACMQSVILLDQFCLTARPSVCLSARPSVCLSVRLSVYPSVCLSVRLSVQCQFCVKMKGHIVTFLTFNRSGHHSSFQPYHHYKIPRGSPSAGSLNVRGGEFLFCKYCPLSRKGTR